MKTGNLLFSAVQFVFAALVILLGVFFIGLQNASHLRYEIADFFAQSTANFTLLGALILGCGVLLLIGFYTMHRGHYYRVTMGPQETLVDPAVIRSYVQEYWRKQFPEQELSVDVVISKAQKMEIFLELPFLSGEKQQEVLEKAEKDLERMLQKQIGYKKEFVLSVLVK
jgi:hypothetical protein